MSDDFLQVSTDAPPAHPTYSSTKDEDDDEDEDYSRSRRPPPGIKPPAQGYGPTNPAYGPPTGGTTVIVNQPQYIPSPRDTFTDEPIRMQCDACYQDVLTSIHYETGMLVYLISIVCCVLGLIAGCCLIPFCLNVFKDVIHSCPNCRHQLGVFRRM